MKFFIGIIVLIVGVVVACWIGFYWCLWGGLMCMVDAVFNDGGFWLFVWGIIRWFLAGLLGWGSFAGFVGISSYFFSK